MPGPHILRLMITFLPPDPTRTLVSHTPYDVNTAATAPGTDRGWRESQKRWRPRTSKRTADDRLPFSSSPHFQPLLPQRFNPFRPLLTSSVSNLRLVKKKHCPSPRLSPQKKSRNGGQHIHRSPLARSLASFSLTLGHSLSIGLLLPDTREALDFF